MKYLYSPIYPLVNRRAIPSSHRSGWALYWAEALGSTLVTSENDMSLEDILRPGDRLHIEHGMEFPMFLAGRPLNIYTSYLEEMPRRIAMFCRLAKRRDIDLVSLDMPMPDYGKLFRDRLAYDSFAKHRHLWSGVDLNGLSRSLSKSPDCEWTFSSEVVIGDSHALSLMAPGVRIIRYDGRSLHGALATGLPSMTMNVLTPAVKDVTFYFGNVDIRHHLARPGAVSVKELVGEYGRQLDLIKGRNLTVALPLPIETSERRVPRTGWYKGAAFYGVWEERDALQKELADRLVKMARKLKIDVYRHPKYFTDSIGQLSLGVMEKPSSVHIRPEFYRHRLQGHPWTCLGDVV